MRKKKPGRGGPRPNSGRPATYEGFRTIPVRLPEDLAGFVLDRISDIRDLKEGRKELHEVEE